MSTTPEQQTSPNTTRSDIDLLGNEAVWTPEIARLVASVCLQMRMGFPGMAVFGQQRCGKTLACEYLEGTLAVAAGLPLHTFMWTILESTKVERDFIQQRLLDSKCKAVVHRDIAVLRTRLYDHMAETTRLDGTTKAAIILDEAQNLTRTQYHHLTDCDNALRKRGIKPFFILVGQPELSHTTTSWKDANGLQVVGRFFTAQHRYLGIALSDVCEVVKGFDEGEALRSIGEALPDAVATGWRLSQIGPVLVDALTILGTKHNILAGVRVPMQYLRAMLLSALWQLVDSKVDPRGFNQVMAAKAISESRFANVMNHYVYNSPAEEAAA
ncbi:ATP-binding protein [Sphaerotilaceae bacterium SBD11-9]